MYRKIAAIETGSTRLAEEMNRQNHWKFTWIRSSLFGEQNEFHILGLFMIGFPTVRRQSCAERSSSARLPMDGARFPTSPGDRYKGVRNPGATGSDQGARIGSYDQIPRFPEC
jgi:hypothetical protein